MIRQIKSLSLLFPLMVTFFQLSGQDSVSLYELQYIDSIRGVITSNYDRQLNQYRELSAKELASNRATIDSLKNLLDEMNHELRDLAVKSGGLRAELGTLQQDVEQNKQIIAQEKLKFSRLLLVTGPSLLVLIMVSTIMFFLLMKRQQESTERKINALRKYAYTEIEETRSDLMKQFRKRIKKLRSSVAVKRDTKKPKKGKNKKRKSKK